MVCYKKFAFSIIGLCILSFSSFANETVSQQIADKNEQRQQAQQRHLDNKLQPQVDIKFDTVSPILTLPPNEAICYPIKHISLIDYDTPATPSRFSPLLTQAFNDLHLTLPHCLGGEGLGIVMKAVQNKIIEQGYVTTRVVVQEQDLTSGELILTVILGRVNNTLVEDSSEIARFTRLSALTGLAFKRGNLLNLRDIEQSLENLKRVPTVDANIDILPAENDEVGLSDLKLSYVQAFPFRLTLGLDDAGSRSTGKYQGSATLSADNLSSANDLFYSSFTHSISTPEDDKGKRRTYNWSTHYSIPFGYWLLSFNHSQNKYRQQVFGHSSNIMYSGTSRNNKLTLSYVVYRNSKRKTTLSSSIWSRQSRTFVDNAEIGVQRRRTAGWEAGIQHKEYIGQAVLNVGLNFKRGTGGQGSLAASEELYNEGTSRMKIILANLSFSTPFMLGTQQWQYQLDVNGQWNKTLLTPQDRFNIGGRYSVRGFDGELTLVGHRGWTLRNDVTWALHTKLQPYLGLDYGKVYQPIEESLGNELMGTVVGLKGELWGITYDGFVGKPLRKPDGFRSSNTVLGFNLGYQF